MINSDNKKIKADDIIKQRALNRVEGERNPENLISIKKSLPAGTKSFLFVVSLCGVTILALLIWQNFSNKHTEDAVKPNVVVHNSLPPLNIAPLAKKTIDLPHDLEAELAADIIPANSDTQKLAEEPVLSPAEVIRNRRLNSPLGNKTSNKKSSQDSSGGSNIDSNSELQSKLQPLKLSPAAAGKISNRNFLLTQGAMIDCQLETRLITTQPGMTSCYVTRNIYSTNGQVILIDRGSKIVGNYQGGINSGQARIFVLWSRIETPSGVIINLDSPGTDSLGEGGVGGIIETHFWERFGGAVMISLIGDFGQFVSKKAQNNRSKGTNIEFNNTKQGLEQAAVEALKNSINIPPALYKNQGEHISIFVARDLDFSSVYDLEYNQ